MPQVELPIDKIDAIIELYSNGEIKNALDNINLLSIEFPDEPLLFNLRGACNAGLSNYDDALKDYKKAVSIKPDYVDAHFNLGNIFRETGDSNNAIISYKKIIEISPKHDSAMYNLGVTFQELGELDDAIEYYDKALIINPDNEKILLNLGFIYHELDELEEALEYYERVLNLNPENVSTINNIAVIHREMGQVENSIEYYKRAISIKPDYAEVFYNLGFIYQDLGEIDKAIPYYETAISINDFPAAYHNLSYLKKYKANDKHLIRMKALISSTDLTNPDRIQICLALAKVYEGIGNNIEFFKYLNEGNRLRKNELNYSINQYSSFQTSIKSLFQSSIIKEPQSFLPSEKIPIFIVGMPRSGTSLVEQILDTHQKVHGLGELNSMTKLCSPIVNNFLTGDINSLSDKSILYIRNEYISMLSSINKSEKYITDKLPLNFQFIGFILSAFPNAKIIHLQRDAIATCWSNYKYYFKNKENGYSNNFDDLAKFYGLYIDLMDFWYKLYPDKIYNMKYETLTTNQEVETKKLLEYCELEWDENCLNFQDNKRAVKTVSTFQVRQKIYQGSSEVWKQYWAHLQPLTDALKSY